ncbi:MAG: vitamin B12-dependent ribonucleotide reductase [Alphaproteobacteria bacterium]
MIEAVLTRPGRDPYHGIRFVKRDIPITGADGEEAWVLEGAEVPAHWSTAAATLLVSQMFCHTGIPIARLPRPEGNVPDWLWKQEADAEALNRLPRSERFIGERSARQVFDRIALGWTRWGWLSGLFGTDEGAARLFCNEAKAALARQIMAPGVMQWHLVGLDVAYGMTGPNDELWQVPIGTEPGHRAQKSKDAIAAPLLYDHVILPGEDPARLQLAQAQLARLGVGSGANLSAVPGMGEALPGGFAAPGLLAALKSGEAGAAATPVATEQPAPRRLTISLEHPDIVDVIELRQREDDRAAALIAGARLASDKLSAVMRACEAPGLPEAARSNPRRNPELAASIRACRRAALPDAYIMRAIQFAEQGYTGIEFRSFGTDWDSEALDPPEGQRATHAVTVPDAFLDALRRAHPWKLNARTLPGAGDVVPPENLLDRLAQSGWTGGGPELLFSDRVDEWHMLPKAGVAESASATGAYLGLSETGAPMMQLNPAACVDKSGHLDLAELEQGARLATIALDCALSASAAPTRRLAERSARYRPVLLSVTGLAGMLMALGLPYDSQQGRSTAAAVMGLVTAAATHASASMAAATLPHAGWEKDQQTAMQILRNHSRAARGDVFGYEGLAVLPLALDASAIGAKGLLRRSAELWGDALDTAEQHGLRNGHLTALTTAPLLDTLLDSPSRGLDPVPVLVEEEAGKRRRPIRQVRRALAALGLDADQQEQVSDWLSGGGSAENAPHIGREGLLAMGLDARTITRIHQSIQEAGGAVRAGFLPHVLGRRLPAKASTAGEVLASFGITSSMLAEAEAHINGHEDLIGCPALPDGCDPVFRYGIWSARPEARMTMAAMLQPLVSGAVVDRLVWPLDARIDELEAAILKAHELGLKHLALYRDGARLSHPQAALALGLDEAGELAEALTGSGSLKDRAGMLAGQMADGVLNRVEQPRPLPASRSRLAARVEIGGHEVVLKTAETGEGALGAVWIEAARGSREYRDLLHRLSEAVSIGLANGVPLEAYVEAFAHSRFEPAGAVSGDDAIRHAGSVLDFAFRKLAARYLGRTDLIAPPASTGKDDGDDGSALAQDQYSLLEDI